jgi:peptidoglycan/LPS O-acetylase OafA/YrhL
LNQTASSASVAGKPDNALNATALESAVERHMPWLDGLRGLAVIIIVWHNVTGMGGGAGHTLPAKIYFASAAAGWVGVTLFFALSGFLITGILLDTRDRPHAWRTFTARRALRIFPLYYVTLAVAFVLLPLSGVLPTWLNGDRAHQVWYWTYLLNWTVPLGLGGIGLAHFWSLAVEEQFYVLWPLVALTIGARRLAAVSAALVLVALVSRIAILSGTWAPAMASKAVYSFTICRWDALALGAIVAIAARDAQWAVRLIRLAWPGTLALIGCALVLGAWRRGFSSEDWVMETMGQLVFAALCAGVVALAIAPGMGAPGWFYRLLGQPWLRTLGKYSYAIYVFHFPLIHMVLKSLPKAIVTAGGMASVIMFSGMFVGILAASFVAALVSWRVLESPMLSLRRHVGA